MALPVHGAMRMSQKSFTWSHLPISLQTHTLGMNIQKCMTWGWPLHETTHSTNPLSTLNLFISPWGGNRVALARKRETNAQPALSHAETGGGWDAHWRGPLFDHHSNHMHTSPSKLPGGNRIPWRTTEPTEWADAPQGGKPQPISPMAVPLRGWALQARPMGGGHAGRGTWRGLWAPAA